MGIIGTVANHFTHDYGEFLPELRQSIAVGRVKCFYCDNPIGFPSIYWSGTFDIFLHPRCFQRWFLRMARDAWEIECVSSVEAYRAPTS